MPLCLQSLWGDATLVWPDVVGNRMKKAENHSCTELPKLAMFHQSETWTHWSFAMLPAFCLFTHIAAWRLCELCRNHSFLLMRQFNCNYLGCFLVTKSFLAALFSLSCLAHHLNKRTCLLAQISNMFFKQYYLWLQLFHAPFTPSWTHLMLQ